MNDHDDLLARLRAADPAADVDPAAGAPGAPERQRVTAARVRRQNGRRARNGLAGGLAAFLGALAIGLSSGGGGGPVTAGLPGVDRIVAQAAHAALMTEGRIVEETIEFDMVSTSGGRFFGSLRQRRKQWIQLDRRGRVRAYRTVTLETDGDVPPGADEASRRVDGAWRTDRWRPPHGRERRWRMSSDDSWIVPDSLTLRAAEILRRAQAGGGRGIELLGAARVGGRPAYRLRTNGGRRPGRWLKASRRELYVDAQTYAPLRASWHEHGIAQPTGRPFTYDSETTIVDRRVLPDTEENRALLDVRGPTR